MPPILIDYFITRSTSH
jgi:hypothetical protein